MTLFVVGLSLILIAAAAALVFSPGNAGSRVFVTLTVAGAVIAMAPALGLLIGGMPVIEMRWRAGVPGGDWIIGMDALSAMFVLVVAALGSTNAVFGDAYIRSAGRPRLVRQANATYALLVAALLVVVTAQSTVLFLCAWEVMAISSFLLIITEHDQPAARRAGLIYIVATHVATLLLFVMFAVWSAGGPDWSFASLAATGRTAGVAPIVLFLALVAFGIKAGFVPLHFWLPPAHAAAPSHVSALMSGVVIKTGIYGLLRVVMLAGPPPAWWAWSVMTLGVVSALLGVLWALAQHDVKRLLAYHSVENVGIILLGMGLGGLGNAYDRPILAVLGYAAAVLHTLNHALFKSLLFMAAGSVYRATGTRDIDALGGLARGMPVTFVMFLVGSVAIIGVPPLNGFVSEWLVYQGLFRAGEGGAVLRLAVLGAPVLGLVGGLALACFAKVAGVIFLGHARTDRAFVTHDVGPAYIVPQSILAGACIAIGLWPAPLIAMTIHIGAAIAQSPGSAMATTALVGPDAQRVALFSALLVVALGAIAVGRARLVRRRPMRFCTTWGCGFGPTSASMQYTASSFAAPLIALFGRAAGVEEHRGATVFHSTPRDLVLDRGVARGWRGIHDAALRLRPMQHGRLHVYLLYVVGTVVVCLAYLLLAP